MQTMRQQDLLRAPKSERVARLNVSQHHRTQRLIAGSMVAQTHAAARSCSRLAAAAAVPPAGSKGKHAGLQCGLHQGLSYSTVCRWADW